MKQTRCSLPNGLDQYLTKGKSYVIIEETELSVTVIDDSGKPNAWSKSRFDKKRYTYFPTVGPL